MDTLPPRELNVLTELLQRRSDLEVCMDSLVAFHHTLVATFKAGGKLLLCGNGGSMSDALHIAGELCKSFEAKRPIGEDQAEALSGLPWGDELAEHLEVGLPALALGQNPAFKTAVENDSNLRDIAFAQEVYVMAKEGDILLSISTSGNAVNCQMAQSAATAKACTTVSLTGPHGGKLAMHADIAIKAPGDSTKTIQEAHICLYHTVCLMAEAHFFGKDAK